MIAPTSARDSKRKPSKRGSSRGQPPKDGGSHDLILEKSAVGFSPGELQEFEELLLGQKRVFREDVEALEEEQAGTEGNLSNVPTHLAERGTDSAEQDLSLGRMESANGVIQEIHEAFERMHDGSFGLCEECGMKLALERLRAIPYARLCIPCKNREERLRQ